jgi:hypothetical protein
LRDRVVFVEGAPRSGTTLISALLAAHPDIAGSAAESHLFDQGVGCLFDNYGGRSGTAHLPNWVSRTELVDLVRDLCDGVLAGVARRTASEAGYILEKTPAPRFDPVRTMERKHECFPDAWHIHIVRDPKRVVDSLMRMPWNEDRSRGASEHWRKAGVEAIRQTFETAGRYREIHYEELVLDPVGVVGGLFDWLGLELSEETRDRIQGIAQERFASHPKVEPGVEFGSGRKLLAGRRRQLGLRERARRLRRLGLREGAAHLLRQRSNQLRPSDSVAEVAAALRERETQQLRSMAAEEFEFSYRGGAGPRRYRSETGSAALLEFCSAVFDGHYLDESWFIVDGRPAVALFSGVRPDGSHLDLSITIVLTDGSLEGIHVIAAGDPWNSPAEPALPG